MRQKAPLTGARTYNYNICSLITEWNGLMAVSFNV